MWNILYGFRQEGHHFRRQVQLGSYDVDFANLEERIVIEVDGGTHTTDEAVAADARRDAYLRERGLVVLRCWNNEVMGNPHGVWQAVADAPERVATPTLDPSPHGGERRRSRDNPLALRERKPRKPRAPKALSPSPRGGGEP